MRAELDEVHQLLIEQPLMRSLDSEHVNSIRSITDLVSFSTGDYLFRGGDPADEFFLVTHGTVAIQASPRGPSRENNEEPLQADKPDHPFIFATVGSGELVGASWLLGSRRWTYDARAMESVTALAIDVDDLTAVCEQTHSLGYSLMKSIGAVLHRRVIEASIQASDIYARWS